MTDIINELEANPLLAFLLLIFILLGLFCIGWVFYKARNLW